MRTTPASGAHLLSIRTERRPQLPYGAGAERADQLSRPVEKQRPSFPNEGILTSVSYCIWAPVTTLRASGIRHVIPVTRRFSESTPPGSPPRRELGFSRYPNFLTASVYTSSRVHISISLFTPYAPPCALRCIFLVGIAPF